MLNAQPVVLDPKITASAFFEPNDRHGARRLLGLLAYGRLCQYLEILATAEEAELQAQIGGVSGRRWRMGASLDEVVESAKVRRALLENRLPPETTPTHLILASSLVLLDEMKEEVDRTRQLLKIPNAELPLRARRVISAHTGLLVGDPQGGAYLRYSSTDRMLAIAAAADAILVTQSSSLAPNEYEEFERVAPMSGRKPVRTVRLWTFIDQQVNRLPFDLFDSVPHDLLDLACRRIGSDSDHPVQLEQPAE